MILVSLRELLTEKRDDILQEWYKAILDTYPKEAAAFLRRNRDRFENPVGQRILEGIEGLLDEILGDFDEKRIKYFTDRVLRVRAVQDFNPSVATGYILALKKAIREVIEDDLSPELWSEFLDLLDKIDEIALYGFDIYMACRERLYHLKVEEWKKRVFLLLKRANFIFDEREGSLPQQ